MKHRVFLGSIILFPLISAVSYINIAHSETTTTVTKAAHEDPDGYYTCPMHPQVHEHKPGKCPICGMPLVKVKGKAEGKKVESKSSPEGIEVSDTQSKYAQISKHTVEKKDLDLILPVSGRALTSREIAFQVYESDLANIKISSEFTGTSSINPSQVLKGRIVGIDRLVDPSSRTVRVTGLLEGSSNLLIESGFHGEIRTNLKNQVVVPIESILHTGTQDLVYAFSSDGKLLPMPVRLGAKGKLEYQILSGLKEGDVISTGPNFLIDSEAKIRGVLDPAAGSQKTSKPECPKGQHWDIPMSMCMPGEG